MSVNVRKSLVLASLFPESLTSFEALAAAIRHVRGRGFTAVEFYTAEGRDAELAALLRESELDAVFIGVFPLKAAGPSLCAVDGAERAKAVATLKTCADRAAVIGAEAVMVNSGFMPKDKADIPAALDSYVRSVGEAYAYIREKGYVAEIVLEPGDSLVQSLQLIGPTEAAVSTAKTIRAANPGYSLCMDVAHIAEEDEDVMESLALARPYCHHIHLCNCLLADPAHPLYGDKHVDFDLPGARFAYADFEAMFAEIKKLYAGGSLTVSLEILCRADNNQAWFDDVARKTSWLFD